MFCWSINYFLALQVDNLELNMWFFIGFILIIICALKFIYYFAAVDTYSGAECLLGKVAIVTGGNKGIGLEVTKCLAARGCKVIIACRSNTESVRKSLIKMTHNENIFVKHLNLQSFESVRNFSQEIHQEKEKVDILINNAGIGAEFNTTGDGLNPVMQTNVFSPFLLTHLLADLLQKSNDGRIVWTSSFFAFLNNLTLDNLNRQVSNSQSSSFDYLCPYSNSKLGIVIISKIFAEKLKMFNIKSNAIHPGFTNTQIWNDLEKYFPHLLVKSVFQTIILLFANTSFSGAQGIVTLAVSDRYKHVSGRFFYTFKMWSFAPYPLKLQNTAFCNEIWKTLESIVNLESQEKL